MDKRFINDIKKIINDMDSYDYISKVRYVVFLICKILYIFKYKKLDLSSENISEIMSKNVSNHENMGIISTYNYFDLKEKIVSNKVYTLIYKYSDKISYCNFIPANLYELLLTNREKKTMGQVYTPISIVDNMLEEIFKIKKISKTTCILDPSCGGGYFLIEAFKKIRNYIKDEKFILENMIYGIDIDDFSIFLTKMGLLFNSNYFNVNLKIFNLDFLTDSLNGIDGLNTNFDIIVGNPPYIGHKQTNKEYRALLKSKYSDVFYDKSDVSYCFFKRSKEMLKCDGVLSFITSRYFMEAMYADRLREFLQANFEIYSINDYSGIKIFKNAMVSPLVITLNNNSIDENKFSYIKYNLDESKNESFYYEQNKLIKSGWIILNNEEEHLFNRIEKLSNSYISDVCTIKQGIITGLDKAFIVTEDIIEKYNLENLLLRKWIKNSNITKNGINYNNLYLIYTDIIEDEKDFPNTINYLMPYKNQLMNRRECRNGIRKWYELQWGRIFTDFESSKIIFPYKSRSNNFYFDNDNYFCSADVYFINQINGNISFEYLQNYLNSQVFEFYFKCIAKKVGIDIYDYYPNKLKTMKIYIPSGKTTQKISYLGKFSIDNFLKTVFNINSEEEKIISKYIYKKGDDAI